MVFPGFSEFERKNLEGLVGEKIEVVVEGKYNTFHGDNTDKGEYERKVREIILLEFSDKGGKCFYFSSFYP